MEIESRLGKEVQDLAKENNKEEIRNSVNSFYRNIIMNREN